MKLLQSKLKQWAVLIALVLFLASCDDEDPPLPDNLVQFQAEELGFDSDEDALTINITLSRETTEDAVLTINAVLNGVTYDTEFTTDPAMTGSTLSINVPKGSTALSFDVEKKEGALFDGDESISFTISDTAEGLVLGEKSTIVVSFSEILAAQATMDANVGGPLQPNKVFIDLSANRQTSFNRSDWDLGFYTGDGSFRVILNSSSAMMAKALDKNDLTTVTAADTVGWGAQLSTDAVFAALMEETVADWVYGSSAWIDAPAGDLGQTAIAEIPASAADSKVYIINRGKSPDGTQRGWKKIRVIRNGNNFTLQHADIASATFTTVEITRDADYAFNYVKFETGTIELEPKVDRWDIAFTVFTNTTSGGPGLTVPYVFNDIVIQNRFSTQTAELLTANSGAYADFDETDLGTETFNVSQVAIGSKWRSSVPGSPPALKEDRFYLVKDSAGNIYKLKFTALSQNGERGRPQIQFALVKKG